jgi:glycerol-3-phosphate dehydrogenase
MNIALAMTAVQHGAIVANHTEVVKLHKKVDPSKGGQERIIGARLKDNMTGEEWDVRCRVRTDAAIVRLNADTCRVS